MLKVYQVLKKFDSQKDYGFEIRPQYAKCLAVMKKGEKIDSKIFANKYKNGFTSRRNTLEATLAVVYKTISIGKEIDILKEIPNELVPILYVDFCKLETVFYFRSQFFVFISESSIWMLLNNFIQLVTVGLVTVGLITVCLVTVCLVTVGLVRS